jgi:hypothetical protein
MADVRAVKSELDQAIVRITARGDEHIMTPESRNRLAGFLRDAIGFVKSNKLDRFANMPQVIRLREAADDVLVELGRLPPEDNAPRENNRGHLMDDLRYNFRRKMIALREALPARGGRKTRRRRYSRRR